MKPMHRFLNQGLILLLLASAVPAFAADKPPAVAKEVIAPDPAPAWLRRIPELFYDALPLGEVVNELRSLFPEINFLVRNPASTNADNLDANSVTVRIHKMRALTLEECLKAIELAAEFPIQITGAPNDRLVVFERKLTDTPPPPTVQPRVFSLARYLGNRSGKELDVSLRELQEAVEVTSVMLREKSGGQSKINPQLHVHQGTKLLIAVGSPAELQVVEQVVGALQEAARGDNVPTSSNATNKLQLR